MSIRKDKYDGKFRSNFLNTELSIDLENLFHFGGNLLEERANV